MTRTTRRILFFIALLFFFGASYIVLLYAQGYEYDFDESRFIRTGAIAIKANTQAHVLLDGTVVETTSFLTNTASLDTIAPGKHTISVQKEGYSVWQKNVVVEEGFVQDFGRVLILPQAGSDKDEVKREIRELLYPPTPVPTPTASAVASVSPTPKKTPLPAKTPAVSTTPSPTPDQSGPYFMNGDALYVQAPAGPTRVATGVSLVVPSQDGRKIAWMTDNNQIWVYWLSDTEYQPYRKAGDIVLLVRSAYPVKNLTWFRGNDHIAFDAGGLKVAEIDNRDKVNIINF